MKSKAPNESSPYVIFVYNLSQAQLLDIHKLKLDILIQDINSDNPSVKKRKEIYEQGGIFHVSPQTIVTDILMKNFSPLIISGICILDAHKTKEKSSVEFSLRLF